MLQRILPQSGPERAVRIIGTPARLAVECYTDRIPFGLSALGIALFWRRSLPMTVILASFSNQKAGLSCCYMFL
jgi:hypothetical protein